MCYIDERSTILREPVVCRFLVEVLMIVILKGNGEPGSREISPLSWQDEVTAVSSSSV
jgi:hypothetical protein